MVDHEFRLFLFTHIKYNRSANIRQTFFKIQFDMITYTKSYYKYYELLVFYFIHLHIVFKCI